MAERKLPDNLRNMVTALFNPPGTPYGPFDMNDRISEALAGASHYADDLSGPARLMFDEALRKKGDQLLLGRLHDVKTRDLGAEESLLTPDVWDPEQPSATFKLIPR